MPRSTVANPNSPVSVGEVKPGPDLLATDQPPANHSPNPLSETSNGGVYHLAPYAGQQYSHNDDAAVAKQIFQIRIQAAMISALQGGLLRPAVADMLKDFGEKLVGNAVAPPPQGNEGSPES